MGNINVVLDKEAQEIMQNVYKLGGSSLYTYYVIAKDDSNYEYSFTFQCDTPELDSYDKLAQYLVSKGFYEHQQEGKDSYYPILSAVSYETNSWGAVNGLFVNKPSLSEEGQQQLSIVVSSFYISSGSLSINRNWLKSDNFKIILVTK